MNEALHPFPTVETTPDALAGRILRSGDRAATARLAALALSGADGAAAALFGGVVERLCDGFTARGARACERVLAQVIDIARAHPSCALLDAALAAEGIRAEADLLARAGWGTSALPPQHAPQRIGVLSRVTLGADLAVAVPLLRGLADRWPAAEMVFLGPEIARAAAEGAGARVVPTGYGRRGGLAERLNAWAELHASVAAEAAGVAPGRWLLVDPDTRLTQLGLLAPGPRAAYRRLPSRERDRGALGDIARAWLGETFGAEAPATPLPLRAEDARWSRRLRAAMTADGRRLVAAGFGTGGNPSKRVGPDFEAQVLGALVADGHRVLLSRGVDPSERQATRDLCAALAEGGVRVDHLPDGRGLGEAAADVVTWQADPGAFLAVIAAADAHLGYDSAGQHVAAALGVPTLTAFVAAAGARHAESWTPTGPGKIRVLRLAPEGSAAAAIGPAIAAMRDLLAGAARR